MSTTGENRSNCASGFTQLGNLLQVTYMVSFYAVCEVFGALARGTSSGK